MGRVACWMSVVVVVAAGAGCLGPDVNFDGTGQQRTTRAATVCVHEFEDLRPADEHDCGFAGPGVYPTDDRRFDRPVPTVVADALAERLALAGFRVVRAPSGRSPVASPPADYDLHGKLLNYQIVEHLNLLTIVPHPAILLTQRDRFDAHVDYHVVLTRRSDGACLMRRSFAVHHKKHKPVGLLYLNRVDRGWGYVMRRLGLYNWFVAGAVSDRVVAAVDPVGVRLASLDRAPSRTHPLYQAELTELAMAPRTSTPSPRQIVGTSGTLASAASAAPAVRVRRFADARAHVRSGPRQFSTVVRGARRAAPTVIVVRRPVASAAPSRQPVIVTIPTRQPVTVGTSVRRPVVTTPTPQPVIVTTPTPQPVMVETLVRRPVVATPWPVIVTTPTPQPVIVETSVRRPVVATPWPVIVATPKPQPVIVEATAPRPMAVIAPTPTRAPAPLVLTTADPSLLRPPSKFQPSTQWEPL